MFRRYRQRRGPYAMATPSVVPSALRSLILLAVVLLVLYGAGKWIIGLFDGNTVQDRTILMEAETGGRVSASFDGGLMQQVEDQVKLHAEDTVSTAAKGNAHLTFFDDTFIRLSEQTDISIDESEEGTEDSLIEVTLEKGELWVKTPEDVSTERIISTPRFIATVPSDAEVVLNEQGMIVFSADGDGVAMEVLEVDQTIFIGEGQQITLPAQEISGDPRSYRSAINPLIAVKDFITESRALTATSGSSTSQRSSGSTTSEILTVVSPQNNQAVEGATVVVEGSVASTIDRVRINGYLAAVSPTTRTFRQELSLPASGEMSISIEALDAEGIVLEKTTRTIQKTATEVPAPTITYPAKGGETFRTQNTEFEIRGTAPAGVAGMMVNDYKLQLFRTGDTTWSYLASTKLNNLKQGTNVYDVYALDAAGKKSDPVRLTILLEDGQAGVVSSGGSTSTPTTISENDLPKNDPLMPGSIAITGPTPGTVHTATGSEFLLAGTTPSQTSSVWVNGYRLQLYTAGKTYWNYIAKVEYQTLKPGTNVYKIVARNEKNEILDTFEYTVTYNP